MFSSQTVAPYAVVFDLEFTAWDDSMANHWLSPGEFKEIVQIGAAKVDADFLPLEIFDMLVRPRINPVLSPYLEKLIGIASAEVEARGVDFARSYRAFAEFVGDLPIFAYGRDDLVFSDNLRLYGIADAPPMPPYSNIIDWMGEQGIDLRGLHACDVGPSAGVPFAGHQHNALDDALSVAAGIHAMIARGAPRPKVQPQNRISREADRIAGALKLIPHPEGGSFAETFRDAAGMAGRAHSTAIYFLLCAGEVSRLHRIDAAEVWHFYRGAPLELTIKPDGKPPRVLVLGPDVEKGERPQIVVPAGAWQEARSLGDYTLVGCTVAPGFEFSTFELKGVLHPEEPQSGVSKDELAAD